ncbi:PLASMODESMATA CALLOSE-BINDING PROTEIN 5 [Abeliophyllum distichum]|uniref:PLASMODESMATA CALLOSE-BINDING PROTEIN 5 n=1 Tax=Abeliophyllum distichum TaxID=126358 RepID=A0ABD1QP00_9LAMI
MASGILTWVLSFFFFALAVVQGGGHRGGGAAEELWCVAKNNAADDALQSSLDWACGAGGADCGPIQKGGPCYDPSDLQRTASFAFNDYFIKHGLTAESCSFSNSAALTSLNPSHNNCKFPSSSLSTSNGSFTGSVTAGPVSADLSSSCSISRRWGRGSIAFLLFFVMTLTF